METGPVLFPIFEVDVLSDLELLPCFTHFNNFEKLDVFYDYPFSSRSDQLKNKGIMQDINCEIELFSSLN